MTKIDIILIIFIMVLLLGIPIYLKGITKVITHEVYTTIIGVIKQQNQKTKKGVKHGKKEKT